MVNVEVVYAKPEKQWIIPVTVNSSATVFDVITKSDVLNLCPEIDLSINKVGIYGELCELSTLIKDQDRVEIYRPLKFDPMTKRFARVSIDRKNQRKKREDKKKKKHHE